MMKYLLVLICLVGATARAQQQFPPPSACPVLASLASSKVHNNDGDNIVIWFWNQGRKTVHGAQFKLIMLDDAGNRYPASQLYQVKGDTKPQSGDVAIYSTKDEEKYLGQRWEWIDGLEVYVTKVMFTDASVWTPRKGVTCKTAFLNDSYDSEMARRDKIAMRSWKAYVRGWNKEHPENRIADPDEDKK